MATAGRAFGPSIISVVAPWLAPASASLGVKTCSACGEVRETLSLADRVFECSACGLKIDRDLNAAINLAAWAENHAQAPERQADARDTNARREERSGPPLRADETSLCEAGTHRTIA
jgi:putative transposase